MKIINALFLILLASPLSFGAGYEHNRADSQTSSRKDAGKIVPFSDKKTPTNLDRNRFKMDLDTDIVREVIQKKDDFRRAMYQTYNLELLNKPITKPLSAISKNHITTQYLTTIIFPNKYAVKGVIGSEKFITLKWSANLLSLKPKRNFLEGNLVVSLTDGKNNKIVDIRLLRHVPNYTNPKGIRAKHASGNQYVSTMIKYIDKPNISDYDILEMYDKISTCENKKRFMNDGDFDIMSYKKITYYIIRDDKFGFILSGNINFRIATEYEGFGNNIGETGCSEDINNKDTEEIIISSPKDRKEVVYEISSHDELSKDDKYNFRDFK